MSDLFLAFGWSNLLLSGFLALVALCVQWRGKQPAMAYLLWLLVLCKLVTPPLWGWAMIETPWPSAQALALEEQLQDVLLAREGAAPAPDLTEVLPAAAAALPAEGSTFSLREALLLLWACGSLVILVVSLARLMRFRRLLQAHATPAPESVLRIAEDLATRLRLKRLPRLRIVRAQLAPLVWWTGGRPQVVLPAHLLEELSEDQLRWVLAHELGHVRRKDHLVRWLEWFACVGFWWNPITWWARRNLRIHEEICCDALVLRSLRAPRRAYATSLLAVVESLAAPVFRPPTIASAMTSGGDLERRFQMIVSKNTLARLPRRFQALALVSAMALLPLGIATAQEPDYEAVTVRLQAAVEAGEISKPQAQAMLDALHPKATEDRGAVARRLKEAVAAQEITPEQAQAMLDALGRKPRNTQAESVESLALMERRLVDAEAARHDLEAQLHVLHLLQQGQALELEEQYLQQVMAKKTAEELQRVSEVERALQDLELKQMLLLKKKMHQEQQERMTQEIEEQLIQLETQQAVEVELQRIKVMEDRERVLQKEIEQKIKFEKERKQLEEDAKRLKKEAERLPETTESSNSVGANRSDQGSAW